MRVLIDDVEWENPEGELLEEERKDLLERARKEAARSRRFIRDILVDGKPLQEEAFLSMKGGLEVKFVTISVKELVTESLEETQRYMPALLDGINLVADRLEEKYDKDALTLLQQVTEGIGWIVKVLHNSLLLLGITDADLGDGGLGTTRERLLQTLEGVLSPLEEGKFFELAYRLREEVEPALSDLRRYIDELLAMASGEVQ